LLIDFLILTTPKSEFYELAKDLPTSFENIEQIDDKHFENNNNVEVTSTHLLVPENSITKMLEGFTTDKTEDNTMVNFDVSVFNKIFFTFRDHTNLLKILVLS
jgi:CRISPR/Cas system CMR subunit Cmr4 (Cas7 group RAMP superfamily)